MILIFLNLFSREEALVCREALASLGHTIPEKEYLKWYEAVRPYPGFKYFWSWYVELVLWRTAASARKRDSFYRYDTGMI